MKLRRLNTFAFFGALLAIGGCGQISGNSAAEDGGKTNEPASSGRVRDFRFEYRFSLTSLNPGKTVRVWLPVPVSGPHQQIEALPARLPTEPSFHTEAKYGNRILYFETRVPSDGRLSVNVPYNVSRREVAAPEKKDRNAADHKLSEPERQIFLQANSRVPLEGKPLELLDRVSLSNNRNDLARQIFDVVDGHVSFRKTGTGWGRGDVLWVCDSRYGNCTDFHSLFISLARSQGIPARFEIGFPIPTDKDRGKVGGYHCWAFYHSDEMGWTGVDISEADKHPSRRNYFFGNLTADRVGFSVGRDIELVPRQNADPLNFFIYPHVEVDGRPLPKEQIILDFAYRNRDG